VIRQSCRCPNRLNRLSQARLSASPAAPVGRSGRRELPRKRAGKRRPTCVQCRDRRRGTGYRLAGPKTDPGLRSVIGHRDREPTPGDVLDPLQQRLMQLRRFVSRDDDLNDWFSPHTAAPRRYVLQQPELDAPELLLVKDDDWILGH
jgi:hypothetical protein